jgi:heme o synthase
VTGALTASMRWPLSFALMIVSGSGMAAWRFGWLCGAFVLAGALTYALVYTVWLKRRTQWNIVIGGLAGSWAVLAGAAVAGSAVVFTPPVILLALVLFLWTPSHFWSLSIATTEDYRNASVPMLPVMQGVRTAAGWTLVNTLALGVCAIAFAFLFDHALVWAATLGGVGYLALMSWRTYRVPSAAHAVRAFAASLVQLTVLLAAIFVAVAAS